ncbi:unnamed protein product, partial [Chrysoparadoxa australica]
YVLIVILLAATPLVGLEHLARFPAIGTFCATSYFTLYSYMHRKKYAGIWIKFLFLSISTLIIFLLILWSGYGRLLLLQFVSIALFYFSFLDIKTRLIKNLFVIAIPVGIAIGGLLRLDNTTFSESFSSGKGALSVFSPLWDTENVYKDINKGIIETVDGESYVAAFFFYIPRESWEDKPIG